MRRHALLHWTCVHHSLFLFQAVTAIYFSQSNYDISMMLINNISLVSPFYVFHDDHESSQIQCDVTKVTTNFNKLPRFFIQGQLLYLDSSSLHTAATFSVNVTVECQGTTLAGSTENTEASYHIDFRHESHSCDKCLHYVPMQLEVGENTANVTVASVLPIPARAELSHLCQLNVSGKGNLSGTLYDGFIVNQGELYVTSPLDAETDDIIELTWKSVCGTGSSSLRVRDRDDNAPKSVGSKTANVTVSKKTLSQNSRKGSVVTELFVLDSDFSAVNNYTVSVSGESADLVNYTNLREDDRTLPRTKKIVVDIVLIRDLIIVGAFHNIKFTVTFNDTTFVSQSGHAIPSHITMLVEHTFAPGMATRPESRLTSTTSTSYLTNTRCLGPHVLNVDMAADAASFTQLIQLRGVKSLCLSNKGGRFQKKNESNETKYFGVTRHNGIIYLLDRDVFYKEVGMKLVKKNMAIPIHWQSIGEQAVTIFVHVTFTKPKLQLKLCDRSCSEHRWKNQCETECGVGAQGRCRWRTRENQASYMTCSPSLTCPDNVCDELEADVPMLCPQDCVFNQTEHPGPCYCINATWCSCEHPGTGPPLVEDLPFHIDEPEPPVAEVSDKHDEFDGFSDGDLCGSACKVGVVIAGCCLILLVALIILKIRYSRQSNKKSLKTMDSSLSLSRLPSDYIDERDMSMTVGGTISYHGEWAPLGIATKLPADPKWEFPRKNLILGEVLGEGEFGKVVKAHAFNIDGKQGFTTVAVKMLKPCASASEFRDLWSECNLLKDVYHRNVIKLLGACTQNGPFYVIVEHCALGSLRAYLRNSRHPDFTYVEGQISIDTNNDNTSKVTCKDLLSFAWQICKGMEYLASTKVIHRDLAARNLLVATGKVIKISDFGLSRDVYEEDTYLKKSKGRIPVKWMAPESLYEHIYTQKSDIWSFGVVLWEIVTLGATPYPGVTSERLYQLLKSGYRMTRPSNCSQNLFHVMEKCWENDPCERPNFRQLSQTLENMMRQNVAYLELDNIEGGNTRLSHLHTVNENQNLQDSTGHHLEETEAVSSDIVSVDISPGNASECSTECVSLHPGPETAVVSLEHCFISQENLTENDVVSRDDIVSAGGLPSVVSLDIVSPVSVTLDTTSAGTVSQEADECGSLPQLTGHVTHHCADNEATCDSCDNDTETVTERLSLIVHDGDKPNTENEHCHMLQDTLA